jgi:hypothetical protein
VRPGTDVAVLCCDKLLLIDEMTTTQFRARYPLRTRILPQRAESRISQ